EGEGPVGEQRSKLRGPVPCKKKDDLAHDKEDVQRDANGQRKAYIGQSDTPCIGLAPPQNGALTLRRVGCSDVADPPRPRIVYYESVLVGLLTRGSPSVDAESQWDLRAERGTRTTAWDGNRVVRMVVHAGPLSARGYGVLFFSSRRRHTRLVSGWSSDVCSSD